MTNPPQAKKKTNAELLQALERLQKSLDVIETPQQEQASETPPPIEQKPLSPLLNSPPTLTPLTLVPPAPKTSAPTPVVDQEEKTLKEIAQELLPLTPPEQTTAAEPPNIPEALQDTSIEEEEEEEEEEKASLPTSAPEPDIPPSIQESNPPSEENSSVWMLVIFGTTFQFLVLGILFFLAAPKLRQWWGGYLEGEIVEVGEKQQWGEQTAIVNNQEIMQEIQSFKEWRKIISLGNQAISKADRIAYDALWKFLRDNTGEENISLQDAAVAQILQVKAHFGWGSRLDPGYALPLKSLFPESETSSDRQLPPEKIIPLLSMHELDWRVRARSAQLLRGRHAKEVFQALIQSIRAEPHLEVLKECIITFQENAEFFGSDVLDAEAVMEWWDKNAASIILIEEK